MSRKKCGFLIITLLLALLFNIPSCTASVQTPTSAPVLSPTPVASIITTPSLTPTSSQATTPSEEVIKPIILRVAPATSVAPLPGAPPNPMQTICNLIENRSNQRVKFEIYWGETLVKDADIITALQTGIADVGTVSPHRQPAKVPLQMIAQLPGIGTDYWALLTAYWELMHQDPLLAELKKFNMKAFAAFLLTDQHIISGMPIRTISDIKGKKIAATGIVAQVVEEIGGVAVSMTASEQYPSLQRGVIDGVAVPLAGIGDFKLYEVGKYFTYIGLGPRLYPICMSEITWNKLPADIQKIITDAAPDFINIAYEDRVLGADAISLDLMRDANIEIIELSPADKDKVLGIQSTMADEWAEQQEAAGLQGKKALSDYRSLVMKYEAISPYKK